jgi:hypothetical protein
LRGVTKRHSFGRVFQDVSGKHPAGVGGSRWEPLRMQSVPSGVATRRLAFSGSVSVRPAVAAIAT